MRARYGTKVYDVIAKTMKSALATAAFVVAAAFFWGGAEAVLNYFWRPAGTWWGEQVWESAFRRGLFYGFLLLTAVVLGALVARFLRLLVKKRPAGERVGWRGAAAAAAIVASNVGWFVTGLSPKAELNLGFANLNLREPEPFYEYWLSFVVLGIALTVALRRLAAPRRWWRRAGKVARAVGVAGMVGVTIMHFLVPALRPVPRGPNVVFIVLDAWRADTFRAGLMPKLTAYAEKNATVYQRTWACAPWTAPSMVSLFTGRYPDTYKYWLRPRSELNPTIAQILRDAGYETAAFVGNPVLEHYSPITAGFDHYMFWDWKPFLYRIHFYDTNWYCAALRQGLKLRAYTGPATSFILTRWASAYVSQYHRRPYFLWLHYMDPHGPYQPPPEYCLPQDRGRIKSFNIKKKKRRLLNHRLYEGECAFLDDLLPHILGKVSADPDTVVIVSSDHGEEFWEHDTYGHGESVYEFVTRVPLIISVPGRPPATTAKPTSHIDLAPTVLDVAGVEAPPKMSGKSLLREDPGSTPELIFVGSEFTQRPGYNPPRRDAVVLWPWKLILRHYKMKAPGEYYDLSTDPAEQNPLPEDAIARKLRKKLRAWKRMVKDDSAEVSALDAVDVADLRALGYIQ